MEPGPPEAAAEVFGMALRQLREQAGLSLRELGRRSLYDYSRLSRAENGRILIPEAQVRVLDDALGAGGLLVALRQGANATTVPGVIAGRSTVTDGEPAILEVHLPGGGSITMRLSRRQFGQLLAAGTLTAAVPGASNPDEASRVSRVVGEEDARVDAEVLGYFTRTLSEYYRADKMLGPRHLIGTVLAQIEVLDSLRRNVRPAQAEPLLRVLSQYSEMCGWLFQDSGDLDAAASWSRQAAEWAQCAGDWNMAAYMLVRQANIAVLSDDRAAVVQLAGAARRSPGPVDPKLIALACQQEARGLALLGEARDCFTLLDQAVSILGSHPDVTHQDAPVYLHHYDLRTLEEQSAGCYLHAGRADTAISILEHSVARTASTLARDRGHLLAKLAVAVTGSSHPDPDRAATLGIEALGIARTTGSARIMRELRTLDSALTSRWPSHAETRNLHEALAA